MRAILVKITYVLKHILVFQIEDGGNREVEVTFEQEPAKEG